MLRDVMGTTIRSTPVEKFEPGSFILITGPAGSGKTTFMKRLLNQAIDAKKTAIWWSKPHLPIQSEIRKGDVVFMTDVQHLLTPGSGYLKLIKEFAVEKGYCVVIEVQTMHEAQIHDSIVVNVPTPMLLIPDVIVHMHMTVDYRFKHLVAVPMVMKCRYGMSNLPFDLLW